MTGSRMFFALALLAAVFGLAASLHAYLPPATGADLHLDHEGRQIDSNEG